jgi:hypothetical protein
VADPFLSNRTPKERRAAEEAAQRADEVAAAQVWLEWTRAERSYDPIRDLLEEDDD